MHEHAGRVEDAAEPGAPRSSERFLEPHAQVAGLGAGSNLLSRALENGRAVSTASGSSTPRTSSSTDGRSRSLTPLSVEARIAAILRIVRRIGLIAALTFAALAGAAVAVVAARDAVYWERPLPGVAVREVALADGVEVTSRGKPYSVDPRTLLRVDEAATAAAARSVVATRS